MNKVTRLGAGCSINDSGTTVSPLGDQVVKIASGIPEESESEANPATSRVESRRQGMAWYTPKI
jgi:hypothetical protein